MKILVAYPTRPSFVARDIEILKRDNFVSEHNYFSPTSFVRGLRAVADCELLFLWFASQRALPLVLAARMMGKPVITVVGGYEAANCPEINYGNARFWTQRQITSWMLRHSCLVLAVSNASRDSILTNLTVSADHVQMLYHGFEDLAGDGATTKRSIVLTVGRADSSGWVRKGVREFFLAADHLSELEFVYVGGYDIDIAEMLGRPMAPNVRLIGAVPFDKVGDYYRSAKVYLQASHHESFGCSVAEAMLYRCIPVVRNAYSLPEVVGNTGVTFEGNNVEAVVAAIRMAMSMDSSEGEKARQRVLHQFSYWRRQEALLNLIDSVAQSLPPAK